MPIIAWISVGLKSNGANIHVSSHDVNMRVGCLHIVKFSNTDFTTTLFFFCEIRGSTKTFSFFSFSTQKSGFALWFDCGVFFVRFSCFLCFFPLLRIFLRPVRVRVSVTVRIKVFTSNNALKIPIMFHCPLQCVHSWVPGAFFVRQKPRFYNGLLSNRSQKGIP